MTGKKQALLLAIIGFFLVAFAVLVGFLAIQKLVKPPAPSPKPLEEAEEEVEMPEVLVQEPQRAQTFSLNRYGQINYYLPYVAGLEACSGQAECQFSARIASNTSVAAEVNASNGQVAWGYTAQPTPATKLYIPRLFKKYYNNWNSGLVIQNTSGSRATGEIAFYNQGGHKVTGQSFTIGANSYQSFYIPDISGLPTCSALTECQFSAIVTSNVSVTAEVNSTDGNVAWGYTAEPTPATRIYVPRVMRNYSGWNSGIVIQNTENIAADLVRILIYDSEGNVKINKQIGLGPYASRSLYLPSNTDFPNLPTGQFSAVITSNTAKITAEINSSNGNVAWGYTAQPRAAQRVYLPRLLKNAYPQADGRNWDSGIVIQNTSSGGQMRNPIRVSVYLYPIGGGAPSKTFSFTIAANGFYSSSIADARSGHFPDLADGSYSAAITGSAPITVELNSAEFNASNAPLRGWGYTAQPSSLQTLYVPRLLKNYYGNWQSGLTIQNTSSSGASGTIYFYNSWKCNDQYECIQDPLGEYPSKIACQQSCVRPTATPTSTPTPTPTPTSTPTPTPTPTPTSTPTPTPTPVIGNACQIDFTLPTPTPTPTGTPTPTPTPTPSFSCLELGPEPSTPEPGDELTFTCRGSALNVEIDHYNFQVLDGSDVVIDSHTENVSATEANYTFTVPEEGGTFKVQCQVCADLGGDEGVVCTQWGQVQ